jgi:hypothetical protein
MNSFYLKNFPVNALPESIKDNIIKKHVRINNNNLDLKNNNMFFVHKP